MLKCAYVFFLFLLQFLLAQDQILGFEELDFVLGFIGRREILALQAHLLILLEELDHVVNALGVADLALLPLALHN